MSLLLITPGAEPLVGRWRVEHDWAAGHGIPAHVTVREPFLPSEQWHDPALAALTDFLPFELTLARLENRPGGLVILVEPDEELRELTAAISSWWPALRPHKEDRPDFAYHVTVARTRDDDVRAQAWDAIAPHLPLPVVGTEMWAIDGSAEEGLRHAVVAQNDV